MSFSFGATAASPAPTTTTGGFGFGGGAAGGGGGIAASSSSSSAPTSFFGGGGGGGGGGGLFGGAPAPSTSTSGVGIFGTPSPAPPSQSSSSTAAAAAKGGGGGGGLFGPSTTAPAAGGGLFGSSASGVGGLFGATAPTAAAPTMQQFQQQQQQQQQQQHFSGNTPYSHLPDNARRAIDQIYQLMMQHRRTLATVRTMAPSLLTVDDDGARGADVIGHSSSIRRGEVASPADAAAGTPRRFAQQSNRAGSSGYEDPSNENLPRQMVALRAQIQALLQSAETNMTEARRLKALAGEAVAQAKMHGAWPVENVAARSGVALSSVKAMLGDSSSRGNTATGAVPAAAAADGGGGGGGGKPASSLNVSGMTNVDAIALQQIMDIRAARVDRIEPMPSPYLWEVLVGFEQRLAAVSRDVEAVRARLAIAEEAERLRSMGSGGGLGGGARDDASLLLANARGDAMASLILYEGGGGSAASGTASLSRRLATLARSQSDLFLRIAAQVAHAHEGLEEVKFRYQRFCQTTRGGYYEDPFLKADVEEFSREMEMQHRILSEQLATALPTKEAAPAAFGTTAAPAAPSAPTSGLFGQPASGLFGKPAPASSTGGLFGTPAPGGLFGSTTGSSAPAPATGGLFGGTPASAPSTGGGLFSAPAPAPAAGGGLFGSTAPAPAAGGGLFGSTAPAPVPATGNLFGGTPAPAPSTGGGLFGATANAPDSGGGLFGSTAPAPSGALFGAAPTTPASTLAPRKKSASRSGGRRR